MEAWLGRATAAEAEDMGGVLPKRHGSSSAVSYGP